MLFSFSNDLYFRLTESSKDQRAVGFLFQRLSIAVQRGHGTCIIDSRPISEELKELNNMGFQFISYKGALKICSFVNKINMKKKGKGKKKKIKKIMTDVHSLP